MKHNTSNRRSRNRGGKRQGGGRNNFESNGPDVKVRGTAQQVLDKYLVLARDASSAGDRIKSESYFQFAEHYYRIVSADTANSANSAASRRESNQAPDPVVAESNTLQSTGSSQTGARLPWKYTRCCVALPRWFTRTALTAGLFVKMWK